MTLRSITVFSLFAVLSACGDISQVGKRPSFSPVTTSNDYYAMTSARQVAVSGRDRRHASLWHSGPTSLLGDRRAGKLGDLLTVVIEIDDKAEISNSTAESRKGSEKLAVPHFFGLPQSVDKTLPTGAASANAVDLSRNSSSSGDGSVRRKEKLTLRVAATVTDVLANGYLSIKGSQEVRVNFELRELLVSGFVRPEDISRKNEITYDKIASARISYGGRGHISKVQQPTTGQQVVDLILPF
ncbi:MAG: flagellar basal body L-ring protein FlgH [Paracoccaceae bacterium]